MEQEIKKLSVTDEEINKLASVLENKTYMTVQNPELNEVVFDYGNFGDLTTQKSNGGNGLIHIIQRRNEIDKLSETDIASLLIKIYDIAKTEKPDTYDNTKTRAFINKDGIKVILQKNWKNSNKNWLVSGYGIMQVNKTLSKEAAETIKTVNAQYGYKPEHSRLRLQVGAVIASIDNVRQNQLKVKNIKNNTKIENTKKQISSTNAMTVFCKANIEEPIGLVNDDRLKTAYTAASYANYVLEHNSNSLLIKKTKNRKLLEFVANPDLQQKYRDELIKRGFNINIKNDWKTTDSKSNEKEIITEVEFQRTVFTEYKLNKENTMENQITNANQSLTPTEYMLEKINAAGIKVHLNKKEMKAILDAGKNVQKMAVKYGTTQNLFQMEAENAGGYGTYVVSVNEENAKQLGIKIAARKYGGTFYINNQPFADFLKDKNFSSYWSKRLEQISSHSVEDVTDDILRADVKGNAVLEREQNALLTLARYNLIEYKREQTYLYSVEIPDNDNTNYLLYNSPIGIDNANRINSQLEKLGVEWKVSRNDIGKNVYFDVLGKNVFNGNSRTTSEFLKTIGFVGMQMDSSNYIIFNDKDMNVTDSVQYMKDKNGELYGFAFEGEIYADEDLVNSNVLAHEYSHIWDTYTQNNNQELWQKGIDVFKGTSLWQEIVEDKNYENLTSDSEILSECHARIVGKMAESILKKVEERDGQLTKDSMIDWDREVSQYITEEFLIKPTLGDENHIPDSVKKEYLQKFLSMPMKDLMNEVKISQKKDLLHSREMAHTRTHGLVTTFPEIAQTAIPQQDSNNHVRLFDKLSQSAVKKINKINTDKIEPYDFLRKIKQSFGVNELNKSCYIENRMNNERLVLRLSDHSTNTYKSNKKDKETSIVIELSKHSFINDKEKKC